MPQRTGGGHVGKTHFPDADRPHPPGRARYIGGHAGHGRGLARQGLQFCWDFFPFSFTESGTYPAGVLEFAVFIWDGEQRSEERRVGKGCRAWWEVIG